MNMDAPNNAHDNARAVEQWLEDSLAHFGKIEPRPGLEGRVLARLAGEREKTSRAGWWLGWAFGGAVALALAMFWAVRPDQKLISDRPVARVTVPAQVGPVIGPVIRGDNSSNSSVVHRHDIQPSGVGSNTASRDELTGASKPGKPPKLEQFPSSAPLSDQERMLALYVETFPEKAALVARAQTDLRMQDELERAAPWPASDVGSSEKQE